MMANDAQRYLDLISSHLQEHHATLLVGSGFSRNADKVVSDVPDMPLWADLRTLFIEKLTSRGTAADEFAQLSPLDLAEQVEIAFGRPELDRMLLNRISDANYRPSVLHRKLLQLPWSDIFTTNYDTLLERAGDDLTDQHFSIILNQNDLLGSAGMTRIIKLHGSFPSQRPFIITAEDYRTYPDKFAPFVNTVQQSLLENTLCLIGFSGDDPNFISWIGWIRDNLGPNNTPYIYLLLHRAPSDSRREWLRRKNIIAVDLSEISNDESARDIYDKALDYLLKQNREFQKVRQSWTPKAPVSENSPGIQAIREGLPILKEDHRTCPEVLTLPGEKLSYLQNVVIPETSAILSRHCRENTASPDELEYLYEYDWLRTKALLPLMGSDLQNYQTILARHHQECDPHKQSVQLSLLRALRERGEWDEWTALHDELDHEKPRLNSEQRHQLQWEECLCALFHYDFQGLRRLLDNWKVSSDTPLWALRKAGILAEYGECEHARELLQQSILSIRRTMSRTTGPNFYYLSLESAMLNLQEFISQAMQDSFDKADNMPPEPKSVSDLRRARHKQYHVSWEEQNEFFVPKLEAMWEPFQNHQESASFDFGKTVVSAKFGSDKDRILAFNFLRFREETGIPFRIRGVYSDEKAACGAAERIAWFLPLWAILTVVRADEPKSVGSVLTRGILSSWPQELADQYGQFYTEAIRRTEAELTASDWFYRNSFARLAADVLPEVLSELCCKCSCEMLYKILDLVEHLYTLPQRRCYQQTGSLVKRLVPAFPHDGTDSLRIRLADFPLTTLEERRVEHSFMDPLEFLPAPPLGYMQERNESIQTIQAMLVDPGSGDVRTNTIDHLLRCWFHGLLTQEQKMTFSQILWQNGAFYENGCTRTLSLYLPVPEGIDINGYLSELLSREIHGYSDGTARPRNDMLILHELIQFVFSGKGTFSAEQISSILSGFEGRIVSFCENVSAVQTLGFGMRTMSLLYDSACALWVVTAGSMNWIPDPDDRKRMEHILDALEERHIYHYGLNSVWSRMLGRSFSPEQMLPAYLRSMDKLTSYHSYNAIATALQYGELSLLEEQEIRLGIAVMAQHIAWCVPQNLPVALQTAQIAAQYQPSALADHLEPILSGLGQLLEQSKITIEDTVASASEKGEIRKKAAALADQLNTFGLNKIHPEILEAWRDVIHDKNEFAEIRNVKE